MKFSVIEDIFHSIGLSINQPQFSSCAIWNSVATTFANNTTVGTYPYKIFVNKDNTVYVTAASIKQVLVWAKDSDIVTQNISIGVNNSYGVFVTSTGDIYVSSGDAIGQVSKWSANATVKVTIMNVSGRCAYLFIDINETLYCSSDNRNIVIKISLNSTANTAPSIAAGNGTNGPNAYMLSNPLGIWVDANLNLYVADFKNNRIQQFRPNELNATTVVGTSGTIVLNGPSDVLLDAAGYLFIVDHNNNRIVGSSFNGFRCIVGCSRVGGAGSDQLNYPYSFSFDSYGNLFVADTYNQRIQKFILATNSCGLSYNRPKISSYTTWNSSGVTIGDNNTFGALPDSVYIDIDNTLYVAAPILNRILVWPEDSINVSRDISGGLNEPYSMFISTIGDVYVDNGKYNGRVDKWTLNATSSVVAMYVNGICYGLFIDVSDHLYCSIGNSHIVVKKSLNDSVNSTTAVAGTGTFGNAPNMLYGPRGIFVDLELNLYVADCFNNRIQLFLTNDSNATTIVGNGSNETITLSYPIAIVLDADRHLFILEYGSGRVVGPGFNGYRCVIGCTGSGSASNQLYQPTSLSFDSYGNLFIADTHNNRVQKFFLITNSCSGQQSSAFLPSCPNYSIFNVTCDILRPCQNNATCSSDNTTLLGYSCMCLPGFNGTQCQYNYRPCQSSTCLNNGICNETSNTTFTCSCSPGWQNSHCETKINYCKPTTCLNRGVCQPLLLNYTCQCISGSYSGQYCEITSSRTVAFQTFSKSFAYIVIFAIISTAMFIIVMDVLKYGFNIDPVGKDLLKKKQAKKASRTRRPDVTRYIYVNALPF
ncbi:unnamed protein product [Adineta ricciae]|uniref:EGF-like domain-containing protein n=1 Tax=Adineta ricciae TaxID=249248 RepID=A0A814W7Y1_ADIRI|nr:unnamed protein product [Adineta ricciae]CAF1314089.1 unnamed protein product [Adineta ricciae]